MTISKKLTFVALFTIITSINTTTHCISDDFQKNAQIALNTMVDMKNKAVNFMHPVKPYVSPEVALGIIGLITLTGVVKLSKVTVKTAAIVVFGCMAAGISFDQILKYLEQAAKNRPF